MEPGWFFSWNKTTNGHMYLVTGYPLMSRLRKLAAFSCLWHHSLDEFRNSLQTWSHARNLLRLGACENKMQNNKHSYMPTFSSEIWFLDKCVLSHMLVSFSRPSLYSSIPWVTLYQITASNSLPECLQFQALASTLCFLSSLLVSNPMMGKKNRSFSSTVTGELVKRFI